ncbi:SGNH/GDSL hydrolase family protein [Actinomycetospora sp. TBRC 11914]|uniref:SGNH/GDSL hydrolase family protein n=1 Tax=Actinomycetospora sp. TBRC 11914 TaxID=2729387 RepID=UPI00145E3C6E|nr:SGNH/GDSL hydrolase family protein [Actinomycetospora sp. TBRC 11914]NMO88382.1 SGNH/GDSL hydrolase family protein [Actinomycetospora sp. TBRC 11914]
MGRARRAWTLAAAVSATVGLLLVGQVASANPAPLEYVNLGDSYSAGSGILPPAPGAPPQCTQSALNWAHDLAGSQGYHLTDVSCGGAQTKDFTTSQFPGVAPQLDALSSSTRLVTLTIGGNDNNVFINAIGACGSAAATTAGQGNPCERTYGNSFVNTINDSTYPNLLKALAAVRLKAPKARVAISGYLQILPPTQGCYPVMPVAIGDVPYLNRIEATLNDAVRRAASRTGVTFLDESATSAGHDACRPIGTRWVEPVVGSTNYVPVHPNALGERAMAERALAVLAP